MGLARLQPERRLMLAVLEDAVWTLLRAPSDRPENARLAAEAEAWLASDDTAEPFAFINVCQALDLEAGRIRAAIARSRHAVAAANGRARPSPFRRMNGERGLALPRERRRARACSTRR
jgi:hypothetical protein